MQPELVVLVATFGGAAVGTTALPGVLRWAVGHQPVSRFGWLGRRWLLGGTSGALAGLLSWRLGVGPELPAYLAFALFAVALAVTDLQHRRLPDRLVALAFGTGLVLLGAATIQTGAWARLLTAVAGAAALATVHLVAHRLSPSSVGGGDVTFAGVVGLHTGWLGWPTLIGGLFAAYLVGLLLVVALLLLSHRVDRHTTVAFGPALAVGALLAIAATRPGA